MSDSVNYLRQLFESGENKDSFDERLTDFFPGIIYVYDVNNRNLKYINKKVFDFLGFSYEDIKEKNFEAFIYKDDVEFVKKELESYHSLDDSNFHTYNSRLNHKGGHWRHFKTMGSVLRRGEDGKPASLLFVAQDITDQLKSEEEVVATRELLNETEEILEFGSWNWEIKTDKVTWTAGLYKLFEYEVGEIDKNITIDFCYTHVAPDDVEGLKAAIDQARKNKSEFECEYQILTKNQLLKTVSTKGKVVLDEDGEIVKMIGITRDVTSIKNFERERERTIRELKRSNIELEEFAYVASHDLQEPLRKISTFSQRLIEKYSVALGKEGALYTKRILASSESMRILIENLLEFSRTTRSAYNFVPVELNYIVENVIGDLELIIEETNTRIVVSALPKIEAVVGEMKQLFTNLLANAIKFRKSETMSEIIIDCKSLLQAEKDTYQLPTNREYFKISIHDKGIGFEEEYADRIFQIFQRLHGKSEYPGSGIGLAICKKITDNHNGLIYAESVLGKGATFYVILPEKQI